MQNIVIITRGPRPITCGVRPKRLPRTVRDESGVYVSGPASFADVLHAAHRWLMEHNAEYRREQEWQKRASAARLNRHAAQPLES